MGRNSSVRDADAIYARHAERELHWRQYEDEFNRIAKYGARRYGMDEASIYLKLRREHDLEYDLLTIARGLAKQSAQKPKPQAPPPPDPEKVEAERRAKARQQEIDALEHEKQKRQRELEVERVDREIRDSQADLRPGATSKEVSEATRRRQEVRQKAEQDAEVMLDAEDAAADVANKKVNLARSKCICIFQDLQMGKGEKRAKILGILDSFDFEHDILDPAIRELLEDGYQEVER